MSRRARQVQSSDARMVQGGLDLQFRRLQAVVETSCGLGGMPSLTVHGRHTASLRPEPLAIEAEDAEGSAHVDGASPLDEEGSPYFDGASPSLALSRACVPALRTCEAGTTTCVRVATTYSAGTSPCIAGMSPWVSGTSPRADDSRASLARARPSRVGTRAASDDRSLCAAGTSPCVPGTRACVDDSRTPYRPRTGLK
jgi:hypothetical protein